MSKEKVDSDLPLEVQLVSGVKNCDACKWFWGDDRPYGPYPSYDFVEKYPKNVKIKYDEKKKKPIEWISAKSNALKFIEPAVMQGCRKAPIMTIGINPNLTAFKPNPSNDTWAYPKFKDVASYAYYYRYKTIDQESFSGEFLQKQISKNKKDLIIAKNDGRLTYSSRSNTRRWMMIKIRYKDGEEETIERTWKSREDYMVNYDTRRKSKFKKGKIIAAKLHLRKDVKTSVFHNTTGYYARAIPILGNFKEMIIDSGKGKNNKQFKKMNLTVGEDIAMHDMIGCASPGWGDIYDIPKGRVIENCIQENSWVIKQIIQSQPKVIIIVGNSSLSMFLGIFNPFINLPNEKDYFELVRKTCEKPHYMKIKFGKFAFTSRIICAPHFSYPNNFEKQFRFSGNEWFGFEQKFANEFKSLNKLEKEHKIKMDNGYNSSMVITLPGKNKGDLKKIIQKFKPNAKKIMLDHYFDILQMIAQGLKQEYDKGELEIDEITGHLKRVEGACHYCKNDIWKFPEGCEYSNADEKPIPGSFYTDIIKKIVKKGIQWNKRDKKRSEIVV